jgi:hypothetical protein
MIALAYRPHFVYLVAAAAVLALLCVWPLPLWVDRFDFFLATYGVLHATALALALNRVGAHIRRIIFVVLTGLLSIAAPWFGLVCARALRLTDSTVLTGAFALTSAAGAASYWLLIRTTWIPRLSFYSLGTTVVLCTCATVISVLGASALTGYGASPSLGADLIPTVAWWFTFSWSLWIAERGWYDR